MLGEGAMGAQGGEGVTAWVMGFSVPKPEVALGFWTRRGLGGRKWSLSGWGR